MVASITGPLSPRKAVMGDILYVGGGAIRPWNNWRGPPDNTLRWEHIKADSWEYYLKELVIDMGLGPYQRK